MVYVRQESETPYEVRPTPALDGTTRAGRDDDESDVSLIVNDLWTRLRGYASVPMIVGGCLAVFVVVVGLLVLAAQYKPILKFFKKLF